MTSFLWTLIAIQIAMGAFAMPRPLTVNGPPEMTFAGADEIVGAAVGP